MRSFVVYLLLIISGCTWRETKSTCVLESDFGFTLNCAFKKSGLFRVRNLGGVKGYLGFGLSVGDELGFRDSLSNLESNKRRSVQERRGAPFISIANGGNSREEIRLAQPMKSLPPFKPLPPGSSRPMAPQPEHQRLVVQQNSTALKTIPAPSLMQMQEAAIRQQQQQQQQLQQQKIAYEKQKIQQETRLRQQQNIQQEALAVKVLKEQRQKQQEAMRLKLTQQQQQVLPQTQSFQTKRVQTPQNMLMTGATYVQPMPDIVAAIPQAGSIVNFNAKKQSGQVVPGILVASSGGLPAFVKMPQSLAQLTDRISRHPTAADDSLNEVSKDDFTPLPLPSEEMAASVNEMTLQSLNPTGSANYMQIMRPMNEKKETPVSLPSIAPIQGMETSLKALAEASNITLEALEAAILLRQQQLMQKHQEPTTTSTTTLAPVKSTYINSGTTKVMNAPREYYPMGYDKNFDDNFASRVDLPDTSFYCGDQKHFPGLYADEDLGCMVFHVCALTDEGLIMKSFLCPESTLFDQTILKCNWWFYVECKNSKNLYDSNIPISKSYQLMKALAFFSAYKNHDNSTLDESSGS